MDSPSQTATTWRTLLRALLLGLTVWDIAFGVYALARPERLGAHMAQGPPDLILVRGLGMMWLFFAWIQYLGFRDPDRYLLAVQIVVSLRLPTAVMNLLEVGWLFPRSQVALVRNGLLVFIAGDLLVWAVGVYCLRQMGFGWWPGSRSSAAQGKDCT